MTLLQKLKEQGWHLTEDGLKKLTTELQTEDVKKITATALNYDMKDIAGGALPAKPESNGSISGRIVLQLQKMRNISAPKANEESTSSPRFLQLELSDGVNTIPALELERISSLSLDVAPGTKFYFNGEKLQMLQGFLVLKAAEVQILGGRVEHLADKWEVARQLMKYAKSNHRLSGAGAPPPWVAFEKRMDVNKESLSVDRNFKSLQAAAGEKDKSSKDNEFNALRNQAIAEAAKAGKKKVFGGGQQNMLDHNLKKILEKGYSEEEASYALKTTNNNLERAFLSLKKRNNRNSMEGNTKTTAVSSSEARGGGPRGRGAASAKEEASASKPQENVSLFDFLTAKIPMNSTPSNVNHSSVEQQKPVANNPVASSKTPRETKNPFRTNDTTSTSNNNNNNSSSNTNNNQNSRDSGRSMGKFENNMSSSFNANRTPRSDDRGERQHSQRSNYNQREERNNRSNNNNNNTGRKNLRADERPRTNNEKPLGSNENGLSQSGSNSNPPPLTTNNNNNNNNNNNQGSLQNSNYNSNLNSNNNRRNDRSARGPRKEREQTIRQSTGAPGSGAGGAYQGNKRNQDNNKTYQTRDNNNSRGNVDNKNSQNNNFQNSNKSGNNFDSTLDKLVESTSKMSLQNKKENYNSSEGQGGRGRHQGGSNTSRSSNPIGTQGKSTTNNNNNSSNQQSSSSSSQFISSQNFTNKSQSSGKQTMTPSPQQQQQTQQQQQQQQQQQTSHTFVSQLPNGYTYDPSKIIGFQSKEANEYAMNLLKSQGLLPQQPTAGPPNNQPPQMISNPQTAAPPAVAFMPQNPNVFVAAPQPQPPPPMAQYGMMPTGSWPWNKGDLCLAKYWEDGNYYDAEITAVSENTCVVCFRGYGNYEEVLKADCLPITDAPNLAMNVFANGPPPQAMAGPMPQQMAPQSYQAPPNNTGASTGPGGGGHGVGGNQRYRTGRQMYVPPNMRGNKNKNN